MNRSERGTERAEDRRTSRTWTSRIRRWMTASSSNGMRQMWPSTRQPSRPKPRLGRRSSRAGELSVRPASARRRSDWAASSSPERGGEKDIGQDRGRWPRHSAVRWEALHTQLPKEARAKGQGSLASERGECRVHLLPGGVLVRKPRGPGNRGRTPHHS